MALRLALLGHGRWGRNIERTLKSIPDVSVTVVARGEWPASSIDAALIATPSSSHAELALPLIEAGIPTFIEKPMAMSNADAGRIRAAAAKSGCVVFVGHVYLYNPAFIAALELLPDLGAIQRMECEGLNDVPRSDCSVLWDWLPHHLSMAHAIFHRHPESVEARSLSAGVRPDAATARFMFGATPVQSTVSWCSPQGRSRLSIIGEHGTLVFDERAPRKLELASRGGAVSYPPYSSEPPLARELHAFLRAVRSGQGDASHVELGAAIVRAISAAEESGALGGRSVRTGA